MDEYQSLSPTKWECKYHVVFMPKYRRKVLYGQLRSYLGEVFRELARQKESRIEEGHLQADHVPMLVSIPPKYAVAQVVGYLKGGGSRILWGNTSGPGGTLCRRWATTKRRCAATFGSRRQWTGGWSSWSCSRRRSKRPLGGLRV